MSTTLLDAETYGFSLTRFAGGIDRGVCFQIDVTDKNVQLTRPQMVFLLAAFLTSENERILNHEAQAQQGRTNSRDRKGPEK